jgi:hypothetical protein
MIVPCKAQPSSAFNASVLELAAESGSDDAKLKTEAQSLLQTKGTHVFLATHGRVSGPLE